MEGRETVLTVSAQRQTEAVETALHTFELRTPG
jgi:hypothetical protein